MDPTEPNKPQKRIDLSILEPDSSLFPEPPQPISPRPEKSRSFSQRILNVGGIHPHSQPPTPIIPPQPIRPVTATVSVPSLEFSKLAIRDSTSNDLSSPPPKKERTKSSLSSSSPETSERSSSIKKLTTSSPTTSPKHSDSHHSRRFSLSSRSRTRGSLTASSPERPGLLDSPKSLCQQIIDGNFDLLTEQAIQQMSPPEQSHLLESLMSLVRFETDSDDLPTKNHLQAQNGIKIITTLFEQEWQKQLLTIIENNPNDAFYITGECVIPSDKLFSLILSQIIQIKSLPITTEIIPESDTRSPDYKILRFLVFTSKWLNENTGNCIIKKAQEKIELIIIESQFHSSRTIQQQSDIVKNRLKEALKKHPNKIKTAICPKPSQCLLFLKNIHTIEKKSDYKKMVTEIAKDLCYRQADFYMQITPPDLFEAENSELLHQNGEYARFSDLLSSYVIDTVLCTAKPQKRIALLKFFIDICSESLALNDFQSYCIIGAALESASIGKIKETWSMVLQSRSHNKAIARFKELFIESSNFKNLRTHLSKFEEDDIPYIPYMGMYLKDIILTKETSTLSPIQKINKIETIHNTITKALHGQSAWTLYSESGLIYSTDFITETLTNHRILDEEKRYAIADLVAKSESDFFINKNI